MVNSSRVRGPTIQVTVPSASRPHRRSICSPQRRHDQRHGRSVERQLAAVVEDLAPVVDGLAAQRGRQHFQVLAHVAHRPLEREPEHLFDQGLVRQADTQTEAPPARRDLHGQRLLRHGRGVARIGRHHGGAQLDALGQPADRGQRAQGIEPEDVRHPGAVKSARLDPLAPLRSGVAGWRQGRPGSRSSTSRRSAFALPFSAGGR